MHILQTDELKALYQKKRDTAKHNAAKADEKVRASKFR